MIVAQERGTEFKEHASLPGTWKPAYGHSSEAGARRAWDDTGASLGIKNNQYGAVLTNEGEAFRQRFVDYIPPEEAP